MGRELGEKSVPLQSVYMRRSLGSTERDGGLRNLREDFEAQRFLRPLAVSGLRQEVDEDMACMEAHGRRKLNPMEEEVDEDCNESSSPEPLL